MLQACSRLAGLTLMELIRQIKKSNKSFNFSMLRLQSTPYLCRFLFSRCLLCLKIILLFYFIFILVLEDFSVTHEWKLVWKQHKISFNSDKKDKRDFKWSINWSMGHHRKIKIIGDNGLKFIIMYVKLWSLTHLMTTVFEERHYVAKINAHGPNYLLTATFCYMCPLLPFILTLWWFGLFFFFQ